ncbi:MAG: nuclear transport factor 2 family protein [Nakamurella sp.]
MTDITSRYLACWNAEPAERSRLVEETFTPTVRYVDPMADVAGHDGLSATISAVRQQFPDLAFHQIGQSDHHHHLTRFAWGLGPAGGEPVIEGFDVVTTADDGRIESVLGFLDRVPAQ